MTATEPIYVPVQLDLIAELKASKDICGIKKLKVERAKVEVQHEQSQAQHFEQQFTSDNFLDKVNSTKFLSFFYLILNTDVTQS